MKLLRVKQTLLTERSGEEGSLWLTPPLRGINSRRYMLTTCIKIVLKHGTEFAIAHTCFTPYSYLRWDDAVQTSPSSHKLYNRAFIFSLFVIICTGLRFVTTVCSINENIYLSI